MMKLFNGHEKKKKRQASHIYCDNFTIFVRGCQPQYRWLFSVQDPRSWVTLTPTHTNHLYVLHP